MSGPKDGRQETGGAYAQEFMTTKEVATYLRIKERRLYELVKQGEIPCTKVTGKWLFPKALIDLWLAENAEGRTLPAPPPPVIAGSQDPLLDWAVKESGCSGYSYVMDYAEEQRDDDLVIEQHGVKLFVEKASLPLLQGLRLDYRREGLNELFKFDNPNAEELCGCGESFTTVSPGAGETVNL